MYTGAVCRNFPQLKAHSERPGFPLQQNFLLTFIRDLPMFDPDNSIAALSFLISHPQIDLDYRVIKNLI